MELSTSEKLIPSTIEFTFISPVTSSAFWVAMFSPTGPEKSLSFYNKVQNGRHREPVVLGIHEQKAFFLHTL